MALTGLVAGAAQADVVFSQSNSPRLDLYTTVVELFREEEDAVASLGYASRANPPLGGNNSLSRRIPEDLRYDAAFLRTLPAPSGGEAWRCLSEALYFEARGEKVEGIFAVAEVILNRVDSPNYPDTVCEVIYQGTGRLFQCQFTYSCDGKKEIVTERRAYEKVSKIARIMLDGAPRSLTDGATHYHTKSVSPRWSRVYPRTVTIGYHIFYRQPDRYALN